MKFYFKTFILITFFPLAAFTQGIVNNSAYIVLTNGSNIYVDGASSGSYTANGTSFLKNTNGISSLILEGNFTNNSSNTGIDGIAFLKIKLNGASQSIAGSTISTLGEIESAGSASKTIDTKLNLSKLTLNGQDVSLNDSLNLRGVLSLSSGTLTTNGKLTLCSSSDSTARVETITNGTISGNVIAQRFIPGGNNKRKWRFLSSSVNTGLGISTNAQYIDDIYVTGTGTGFDDCGGCSGSIKTYDETITGTVNNGWVYPNNISNSIATGSGVAVFVRGSRSLADPFLNWTVPDNVIIDFVGALNTGDVVKPLSFTNNGQIAADGMNFVGNPYHSPIDWSSPNWVRTNMGPYASVYNPNTGNYNYLHSDGNNLGDPGVSSIIPSNQGFFVKATSSGATMTFKETVKSSANPFSFFKPQIAKPNLKIVLSFESKSDRSLLVFDENSTSLNDDLSDAQKFMNDKINLYSLSKNNKALAINYLPYPSFEDSIRIAVWDYDSNNVELGTHNLFFDNLSSLDASKPIYLWDAYTNITQNIFSNNSYNFEILNDVNSFGNRRFYLIFNSTTGVVSNVLSKFKLYPNPSKKVIYLASSDFINAEDIHCKIFNSFGQLLIEEFTYDRTKGIEIAELSSGIYFIEVNSNSAKIMLKFLKEY